MYELERVARLAYDNIVQLLKSDGYYLCVNFLPVEVHPPSYAWTYCV